LIDKKTKYFKAVIGPLSSSEAGAHFSAYQRKRSDVTKRSRQQGSGPAALLIHKPTPMIIQYTL
jgi:hypothetical protein